MSANYWTITGNPDRAVNQDNADLLFIATALSAAIAENPNIRQDELAKNVAEKFIDFMKLRFPNGLEHAVYSAAMYRANILFPVFHKLEAHLATRYKDARVAAGAEYYYESDPFKESESDDYVSEDSNEN